MNVKLYAKTLSTLTTQALIVIVPEGQDEQLPKEIIGLISRAAHQSFRGKLDETLTVFPSKGDIERIVLVGLGDGSSTRGARELFRRAVALGIKQLNLKDVKDVSLYLGGLFELEYMNDAVLIATIAPYRYSAHKSTKEDEVVQLQSLTLVAPEAKTSPTVQQALESGASIGSAVNQARELINTPGNHLTPAMLAAAASALVDRETTIEVTVWGEAELRKRKFGALLAVSRGSQEEARLITLHYKPKVVSRTSKLAKVALVGKGITFDTGGINLKPSQHIGDMHMDMAGGAAVLAAVSAVAALKLPIEVVAVVPATENMPGGSAVKPGDVVVSHSGKTIEIADTDAEGRVVLADGLAHAASFKPDYIVDIATLTGAVISALGEDRAAVVSNNQDLADQIVQAGDATGELVWQLPLDDDYRAYVKSDMADVSNLGKGKGRQAGTIAGGAFLEKFVPKGTPWAHLDIAGTGMRTEAGPYWPKGGTGWGVQLLVELLTQLAQ